jgi:hypothetical protein
VNGEPYHAGAVCSGQPDPAKNAPTAISLMAYQLTHALTARLTKARRLDRRS